MQLAERPRPTLGGLVEWFITPPARGHWLYRFIFYPLLQITIFVVSIAVFLTAVGYLIAFLFPQPNPAAPIFLADQISRQLPGMIISGISIGFVYSMVALGYTLVYGVLKFINFAHSEIFMFGSVLGFEVMRRIDDTGALASWNPVLLVLTIVFVAMIGSGLLAVGVERIAYRPLRSAPRLVPLISAIGVSFFLIDTIRAIEAVMRNDFNLTYPKNDITWITTNVQVAFGSTNVNIKPTSIIMVIGAIITLMALNWFVNGTKLGRGIRAVSQDQSTASLMGINVDLMISLTFFIGGAFGGAAGALFGLNAGTVTPYIGFIPGVKAFTAAVLGGIGNVTGALLGGLTIGMLEAFLNGILVYFPALGQRWTDIFVFAILIIILIFRPGGLLGERVDEKV